MSFNTLAFAVFLPTVILLYWQLFARLHLNWRSGFLLLASYVFYGFWDWRFLGLILFSSAADYLISNNLGDTHRSARRKLLVGLSALINLGLLATYKYFGFFADSFATMLTAFGFQADMPTLKLILPVGISFYTFQTLGYTIDVFQKRLAPEKNPIVFFTYVAFFPQLVAGPIERASRLLPQLRSRPLFDPDQITSGLRLILWGYFQKVVIADNLASYVNPVYDNPEAYGWAPVSLAIVAFSLQIYGDFAGYSNIAIGVGRLLGIELMTNFRAPYRAASVREFWQRWHISLSTWFRDYLYIPLGGNRVGSWRNRLNILVTFTVSGLWHGAHATFVVWGFLHGIALLIERALKPYLRLPREVAILMVSLFVSLCWIPFRAQTWSDAETVFLGIFRASPGWWDAMMQSAVPRDWFVLGCVILLTVVDARSGGTPFDNWMQSFSRPVRWFIYFLLAQLLILLGNYSAAPEFIYFQF